MHLLGIASVFYGFAFLLFIILRNDAEIASYLNNPNEGFRYIMTAISYLGTLSFLAVIFGVTIIISVLNKNNLLKSVLLYASAVAGTVIITYLMKIIIQRERPFNLIEAGFSFPSGHSSASMAAYSVLAFFLWQRNKKLAVFSFIIPLFIGFSRIFLNVHWISDVFAGLFLGASVTFFLINAFYRNQKNDAPPHLKRWGLNRLSFFGCSRNHSTLKGGVFVKFLDIRMAHCAACSEPFIPA